MVFNRVRPAKHRKAAVARIADQQAAGFFDRAFKMVEDAIEKLVRLIRVDMRDVAGGIDRVDGEHRQHGAFRETSRALHRPPLRNYLCGRSLQFYQKMMVARQRNEAIFGPRAGSHRDDFGKPRQGRPMKKSPRPFGTKGSTGNADYGDSI